MNWTSQQILALSPDASTTANGKKLSDGKKISNLGTDSNFIWGECQGSGSSPYYIVIDLADGAAKCNCPSRKFPCKHSIGFFLYYAANASAFSIQAAPKFASDWIDKRLKGAEKKAQKEEEVLSPEALAKKKEQVAKKDKQKTLDLKEGLEDAILWVEDIIRVGIAEAEQNKYSFGEKQKKWTTDLKAEGLRLYLDTLTDLLGDVSNSDWIPQFLKKLGTFYLLLKMIKNVDKFPQPLQDSILYEGAGFLLKKEDIVDEHSIVTGKWVVLGVKKEEHPNKPGLFRRFTWLYGIESHTYPMIMDFSFGGVFPENYGAIGSTFSGEIVMYPGVTQTRALVKSFLRTNETHKPHFFTFEENLQRYAQLISLFPWIRQYLFPLKGVKLIRENQTWMIQDDNKRAIPIPISQENALKMLAVTGSNSFQLVAEWDNQKLKPMTVWLENEVFPLSM